MPQIAVETKRLVEYAELLTGMAKELAGAYQVLSEAGIENVTVRTQPLERSIEDVSRFLADIHMAAGNALQKGA